MRLLKALYGTKQGGNEWRHMLLEFMVGDIGWTCSDLNWPLFYRNWEEDGSWAIVGFWVDDSTTVGTSHQLIELEDQVRSKFGISSEGPAQWILGMAIRQNVDMKTVYISQREYIEGMAKRFNLTDAKPVHTPLPLGMDLSSPPSAT